MTDKTILLVEDEMIVAASQAKALERYGYKVHISHTGEDALKKIDSLLDIELVLMDIDLGKGMDGTATAELILQNHQIPIIFLSSHTDQETVEKTERITSYGYVVKNSNISVLDTSIKMASKLFETQRTLEKTSQLLESTGKLAKIGGWQIDLATRKVSWTSEIFSILETEPPNVPLLEEGYLFFTEDSRPKIINAIQIAQETGTAYDLELTVVTAKGRPLWVQTQGFAEMRQGKAIRLYGTFQDITERKKAELTNLNLKLNIETLLNSNTDLMWSLNPDYSLISANSTFIDGFHKTTGLVLKAGDSLLMKELFPEDYLVYWKGYYDRALQGEEVETEIEIPTEDPNISQLFQTSFKPIQSEKGILGACCYGRNITERRKFEQKINSLLHEKELILREVHHRIKNNMTMMSSLLNLQANSATEGSASDALMDASRRVQSMTILYDKLYKSQDFGKLPFGSYIKQLIDSIVANFYSESSVRVEMKIEDFEMDTKNMQTLGIIINELITNIMKYAFTNIENCEILISTQVKDNIVTLHIKDNGIGLPQVEIEGKGKGFGLLLVRELTNQLSGKISFQYDHGTDVQLIFTL